MGASGAGVTTLGRALAETLAIPHHDTDDYFWRPTTPPYREKREVADRLRLMREVFLDRADWVLSGSLDGWGTSIVSFFDLVVFLYAPTEVRLRRLREREARHFAPTLWCQAAGITRRRKNSSPGQPATMTAPARAATGHAMRHGLPRFLALSSASMARARGMTWSTTLSRPFHASAANLKFLPSWRPTLRRNVKFKAALEP